MRLWSYQLLPYLPDAQFHSQLRELVAIMHDWRDKNITNHLLINRVMLYPKSELTGYFNYYQMIYKRKFGKINEKYWTEFQEFSNYECTTNLFFYNWHNDEYLRVCMANLYEKYKFGVGKSKISELEWIILLDGYKKITGKNYII